MKKPTPLAGLQGLPAGVGGVLTPPSAEDPTRLMMRLTNMD